MSDQFHKLTFVQRLTELDVRRELNLKTVASAKSPSPDIKKHFYLRPEPSAGSCYLGDVAHVLRSKIAGPYEITLDVMFPDAQTYEKVKDTGLLTGKKVADLYGIPEQDIIAALWWKPALAFKATIPRYRPSAGFEETDTHGSQQHAPLLFLHLPWSRSDVK